ncbi:DNA mismatch repair protein MutS [Candidatus Woesearchaeota archaeon]|nr:DNA mismatch repair protein MutS [Candidatus Woesearchaeota archaeon]
MKLTPGMQQYMQIKNKHPDCIVMFRMGDFYEMFFEDAKTAAKELEITLTARGKGDTKAPLAGIPYHAIEPYVAKLIKKGYKVAICEQVEDPKLAKGLVKRDLVRIITPGTVVESIILDDKKNNYLMAIAKQADKYGIALADISTGEFLTSEFDDYSNLINELSKFSPSEILIPLSLENAEFVKALKKEEFIINTFDDRFFWKEKAYQTLKEHFNVLNLQGFDCEDKELCISSAGALISYLKETQKKQLEHINSIKTYYTNNFMMVDKTTQRNLELASNIRDGGLTCTVLSEIDKCITSMGSRLLRKWLLIPLLDKAKIEQRLNAVEELYNNPLLREELKEKLKAVYDIERLIGRVTYGNANARDLIALKNSLRLVPEIKILLKDCKTTLLNKIKDTAELTNVSGLIDKAIKEEPALILREGNLIKAGFNEELDRLRGITKDGKSWIAELETKEKRKTGIKSLKIRYNKVFGYFIEVSKANLHLVPQNYIRKQTQVNSERFITEELKEQENRVLGAEEKIFDLEYELFQQVLKDVAKSGKDIQAVSKVIAETDTLLSFANVAAENNYIKPVINDKNEIVIKEGRHPVIESMINEPFVPNDCNINDKSRFMIITGPNMSGKSSFMRQVALIVLMSQIGSFVPAKSASIGIVDRIFTRVGAYDDLTHGQSTFMVEMNETANIVNNATEKSLIILDEIGRGTSTYDGISIAWSVAEYIHKNIRAKALFATHYHQMNKLSEQHEGIKNYNIAVKEVEDSIVFLHKIIEGGTDKSYGIEVARLAGLPKEVIENSKEIMKKLEAEDKVGERIHKNTKEKKTKAEQMSLLDI